MKSKTSPNRRHVRFSGGHPFHRLFLHQSGLKTVIHLAFDDARAAGKDYFTETREAVRAVLKVRPDMTASEALTAVELVRQS